MKLVPMMVACMAGALAAADLPIAPTPFAVGNEPRRSPVAVTEGPVTYGLFVCTPETKCNPGNNPSKGVQISVREHDGSGIVVGMGSVRACSLEFRTFGVKDRRLSCDACVSFKMRAVDRPGWVAIDYHLDFAKLAGYAAPGACVGVDCRLSTPRNTPDLVVDTAKREVSVVSRRAFAGETVRFEFPTSVMKTGRVETMGGREKICQHFVWRVSAGEGATNGTIFVDMGCDLAPLRKLEPSYGEVDFDRVDAIHVPLKPTRNLMFNGGFEKGLEGWKMFSPCGVYLQGYAYAITNGAACYEQIVGDAKLGRYACRFRNVVKGTPLDDVSSATLSLKKNTPYVVSFWTKRDPEAKEASLRFALRDRIRARKGEPPPQCTDLQGRKLQPLFLDRSHLGADWTRHELAFKTPDGCVEVALSGKGCLVDGIMLEEGTQASETTDRPIVAKLVTESPENDLKFGTAHTMRLAITRQHGGEAMAGQLRMRIFNYYTETVYDHEFAVDKEEIDIPNLDWAKIGKGVFVVRYDFTAAADNWNLAWTDYERFAVTDFLKNEHPTAFFFLHYPFFQTQGSMGPRLAEWMISRGIGSTSWPRNDDRMSSPLKELYASGKFRSGVHTLEHDLKFRYPQRFRPGTPTLIQLATNVTEEVLAFVEKEAYRSGSICVPEDNRWAFGNEEEAWCPILNRKDGTNDFKSWGRLQKACYTGLKRAFDERGLVLHYAPSHGMCNFHLEWSGNRGKGGDRRWAFERMLEVGAELGIPYDYVSMHLYSAIDGSVLSRHRRGQIGRDNDRGEEALALFEVLRHHGLGHVPLRFEEGFNIAPFYIPAWGAHGWADTYYGTYPALAAGQSEFLQAGAIARQYLMDLRWWPRVETSHVWQHRPVMDFALTPWMWTKVSNTIGHLLPDPRGTIEKRFDDVKGRAFCYRQKAKTGNYGILALWTCDNAVELGIVAGGALNLSLPAAAEFIDLMGNVRGRACDFGPVVDGRTCVRVPLTPAPLFVKTPNVHDLEDALEDAEVVK